MSSPDSRSQKFVLCGGFALFWVGVLSYLVWHSFDTPYVQPLGVRVLTIVSHNAHAEVNLRVINHSREFLSEANFTVEALDRSRNTIAKGSFQTVEIAPRASQTVSVRLQAKASDIAAHRIKLASAVDRRDQRVESRFRVVDN